MNTTKQFQPGFWSSAAASWQHAWQFLKKTPWFIVLIMIYLLARIVFNMAQGAHFDTALRSALIGAALYALAALLVDWLFFWRKQSWQDVSTQQTHWLQKKPLVLILIFLIWFFWLLEIIDRYQRGGLIIGTPVLHFLPFYASYLDWLNQFSVNLANQIGIIPQVSWFALINNVLLRLVLPILLLLLLRYPWKDLGFHFRNIWVVAPFLVLLIISVITSGEFSRRLPLFLIGIIYPALTEEFLYRGWMQRSVQSYLGPTAAILISALFFSFLHVPVYFLEYTGQNLYGLILSIIDLFIAGLFYGYIFRRTGSLWHNAFLHSLMNSMG